MDQHSLLSNIGLVFVIATAFAFLAKFFKQPLILAYLVAGVVIGPEIGFAWIQDEQTIELISEIGLILLLFIIGLEIDLKKLLSAGRTVLVTGIASISTLCRAGHRPGASDGIYAGPRQFRLALSGHNAGAEQHVDRREIAL